MSVLSSNWIAIILFGLVSWYIYQMGLNLYHLTNPLSNIKDDKSITFIEPFWKINNTFSIICYLSTTTKLNTMRITDLFEKKQVIFFKDEIVFGNAINDVFIDLNLISSSISSYSSVNESNDMIINSKLWLKLKNNESSVYLHVLLMHETLLMDKSISIRDYPNQISKYNMSTGLLLHGYVSLVKYSIIPKLYSFRYLLSDFGLYHPNADEIVKLNMSRSLKNQQISYWKPEVAVKLVIDESIYPYKYFPDLMSKQLVSSSLNNKLKSKQWFYTPVIHVDEIGLTSDKYIPLNSSINSLPLKITLNEISVQRWLFMAHIEQSLLQQNSELGIQEKDIDDIRRLITDTSIELLGMTVLASILHLLFEFLAFQSDVQFWSSNSLQSMSGLSLRAIITELISSIIIFLYLLEQETTVLVLGPFFIGILIQLWKAQK